MFSGLVNTTRKRTFLRLASRLGRRHGPDGERPPRGGGAGRGRQRPEEGGGGAEERGGEVLGRALARAAFEG